MTQSVNRLPNWLDYAYRPSSYFQDLSPETLIVASILGEERRKDVKARLASAADPDQYGDWLTQSQLEDSTRQVLGRLHPAYMGGEYLPNIDQNEIEIARIVLASTTQDVISIRARRTPKFIAYRVVDEYENEFRIEKLRTRSPLSLEELIDFIDGSYQEGCEGTGGLVLSILSMNIDATGDVESMREFISVSSDFYPELARYYRFAIEMYLDERPESLRDADDESDDDEPPLTSLPDPTATRRPLDLQNLPVDPATAVRLAAEKPSATK